MDFVHDQLGTGRKLRVLTIVDTFSRFSPALEPTPGKPTDKLGPRNQGQVSGAFNIGCAL